MLETYKMTSTEIILVRNCIHMTVILYFHVELMSKSKNFKTKTRKAGLYDNTT